MLDERTTTAPPLCFLQDICAKGKSQPILLLGSSGRIHVEVDARRAAVRVGPIVQQQYTHDATCVEMSRPLLSTIGKILAKFGNVPSLHESETSSQLLLRGHVVLAAALKKSVALGGISFLCDKRQCGGRNAHNVSSV